MSTLAAPVFERTHEQQLAALRRANEIRCARAQLKKELKSGAASIKQVLLDPPACVLTAKLFDVLQALPKFGRVKAARLLQQCRISQSKTIGGLSSRQRTELVALLDGARG